MANRIRPMNLQKGNWGKKLKGKIFQDIMA